MFSGCNDIGAKLFALKQKNISQVEQQNATLTTASKALIEPFEKEEEQDLWPHIRKQLGDLTHCKNSRIDRYVRWFAQHPYYFKKLMDRSKPYLYFIVQEVEKRGMPIECALVPFIESCFDPFAYSYGLATGLWQITLSTGRYYEVKHDWWFDGRRDIVTATNFALDYLKILYQEFKNWELALAAYNAGKRTVMKAMRHNAQNDQLTDYWSLPLPRQTVEYVPKLLALAAIIKDPKKYKITINPIANKPFFHSVDVGSQVGLMGAAELAGIPLKELRQLNPGYNRWATDPAGPFCLLIPVDHVAPFKKNLHNFPLCDRIRWLRYTVSQGDTLHSIAQQFSTTVDVIKTINHLQNEMIYTQEPLLIPQSAEASATMSKTQTELAIAEAKNIVNDPRYTLVVHTVQSGDNLWKIAKKHGVSVQKMVTWNKLKPDSVVNPGDKLSLWLRAYGAAVFHYKVKSGDSFWSIAEHFKIRVEQLMAWNDLVSSVVLHPNQILKIFHRTTTYSRPFISHAGSIIRRVLYTVRKGESIGKVANKFHVNKDEITHWNCLKNDTIQPGQRLKLFVDVTRAE